MVNIANFNIILNAGFLKFQVFFNPHNNDVSNLGVIRIDSNVCPK